MCLTKVCIVTALSLSLFSSAFNPTFPEFLRFCAPSLASPCVAPLPCLSSRCTSSAGRAVVDNVASQKEDDKEMLQEPKAELKQAVVLLVDIRREPQEMDGMLLFGLREAGIPYLVVATKVDKLKRRETDRHLARIAREFQLRKGELIGFSAIDGTGLDLLWQAIERATT